MGERFKSKKEIVDLASALKARRLSLGLTLKDIEESQKINCGQLSRLEAGQFKTNSPNLQKLCKFLQLQQVGESALGIRLERFAARSRKHQAVAEELISALEQLD